MNPLLTKNYDAGAAITKHRIVMFGASDGVVLPATAATDLSIGISEALDVVEGERVDVIRSGLADVEYGGAVTRGQELTSDASGKAVAAAPASGANVRIIGVAELSGVDGDIGKVDIAPSVMQGA